MIQIRKARFNSTAAFGSSMAPRPNEYSPRSESNYAFSEKEPPGRKRRHAGNIKDDEDDIETPQDYKERRESEKMPPAIKIKIQPHSGKERTIGRGRSNRPMHHMEREQRGNLLTRDGMQQNAEDFAALAGHPGGTMQNPSVRTDVPVRPDVPVLPASVGKWTLKMRKSIVVKQEGEPLLVPAVRAAAPLRGPRTGAQQFGRISDVVPPGLGRKKKKRSWKYGAQKWGSRRRRASASLVHPRTQRVPSARGGGGRFGIGIRATSPGRTRSIKKPYVSASKTPSYSPTTKRHYVRRVSGTRRKQEAFKPAVPVKPKEFKPSGPETGESSEVELMQKFMVSTGGMEREPSGQGGPILTTHPGRQAGHTEPDENRLDELTDEAKRVYIKRRRKGDGGSADTDGRRSGAHGKHTPAR